MKSKTYYKTPSYWGVTSIVEKLDVSELIRKVRSAGEDWNKYNKNELIELCDYHGDVAIERSSLGGGGQSFTGATVVKFYRISTGEFLGKKIHTY